MAKKYPGIGLGLALAKRYVEEQGGEVGIHSVANQGSTFFAILPRVLPQDLLEKPEYVYTNR